MGCYPPSSSPSPTPAATPSMRPESMLSVSCSQTSVLSFSASVPSATHSLLNVSRQRSTTPSALWVPPSQRRCLSRPCAPGALAGLHGPRASGRRRGAGAGAAAGGARVKSGFVLPIQTSGSTGTEMSGRLCDRNRAKMVVKQSERHWLHACSLRHFAPNDLIRQCLLGKSVCGIWSVVEPTMACLRERHIKTRVDKMPHKDFVRYGVIP